VIRIENLDKSYGRLAVLRDLTLTIPRGQITALVGPNAAGKTTLIKSILGLVRPAGGQISIDDHLVGRDPVYRERIGYMPQHPAFPDNLAVRELLAFMDDIRGVSDSSENDPFDRAPGRNLIDAFDLASSMDKKLGTLSGGTRQKVNAAIAFRYGPDLLILDEPTAGLDPLARSRLKSMIQHERERGTTVLITSHVLSELRDLAEHIVYLVDGRLRLSSSVHDLLRRTGAADLEHAVARMMSESPDSEAEEAGTAPDTAAEAT
jgi:Cu-processing system ATP-binding protein